jgi:hypothetical protein
LSFGDLNDSREEGVLYRHLEIRRRIVKYVLGEQNRGSENDRGKRPSAAIQPVFVG